MNLQWILWVYDVFTFPIGIPRRIISLMLAFVEQVMDPQNKLKDQPHGFQQAEFDGYEDEAMQEDRYDDEYRKFPVHSEPAGAEHRRRAVSPAGSHLSRRRSPSPAGSHCSHYSHLSSRSHYSASRRRVTPAEMQSRIRSMEEEEEKLKDLRESMQEQLDIEIRSFTPIQPVPRSRLATESLPKFQAITPTPAQVAVQPTIQTPVVVEPMQDKPVAPKPTPVAPKPTTVPVSRSIVDFTAEQKLEESTVQSDAESFLSALSSASDVSRVGGRRRNKKKKKKKKKRR